MSFRQTQTSFGMDDLDGELALLELDQMVQRIGEHELKTSPLVTRDAVNVSGGFAQRGLLGAVLSVHADDLPDKTVDPRIYLNLDAPSSGLVCGVQGSGKSHTVSCILESSLMTNRQIGTLPAPLGTVVFHFDEENGQRPCEAAYLSELKDDTGLGVDEVVVLVSPSNLRTRTRVYSSLKFVRVEPLRIAEQDLNATRMLSMMGADNLETMPLYMHTILSILREMGSDDFNYRDFNKRLKDPEFNKSQSAMLQLRLDLLDSFLQGNGPDVKSFFKPGRLVIIDISDPFVESTTAAMLFDICLGLFIEWKSSTGKLIILDEAHKYLTNSDANRFTKSICSIIRQQRHLAARVIVSTQEPTVVPASVLDLLSWIVCHRFSSPGWVRHLKHHICAEEDEEGRKDGSAEWGKRVMMLRTGEAILYSPASLFATEIGETATLATGYAIIKTRPRLTSDGGASLLATETRPESTITGLMRITTPPTSDNLLPPMTPYSSRVLPSMIPPNTPIPRIIDLVAASSANPYIRAIATPRVAHSALASPPSSNPAPTSLAPLLAPKTTPAAVAVAAKPSGIPTTTPNPTILSSKPSNHPSVTYSILIQEMNCLYHAGTSNPDISTIGAQLTKQKPRVYSGILKDYLLEAQNAGIIIVSGEKEQRRARLATSFLSPKPSPAAGPSSLSGGPGQKPLSTAPVQPANAAKAGASTSGLNPTSRAQLRNSYKALIEEMSYLYHAGHTQPTVSDVGARFTKYKLPVFTGKLSKYLEQAQTAGVVTMSGNGNNKKVKLLAGFLLPKASSAPTPPAAKSPSPTGGSSTKVAPIMIALLAAIAKNATQPKGFVWLSEVGTALKVHMHGDYKKAGYGQLGDLAEAAAKAGLVVLGGTLSRRTIRVK